jgi:hypothetical protein
MPTTINADTSTGGAIITGDTSGVLQLQSGGITAVTLTGANVTTAGNLTVTGALNSTTGLTSPALIAGGASGAQIRLGEATGSGTNYAAIKAPDTLAADYTLTLPTADGTSGQFLQTNGSGQLAFATPSSGTQQFTSSGSITAGQAVSINTNGTVSTTTGISQDATFNATNLYSSNSYTGAGLYDAASGWHFQVSWDSSGNRWLYTFKVSSAGVITNTNATYIGNNGSVNDQRAAIAKDTTANRFAVMFAPGGGYQAVQVYYFSLNTTTGATSGAGSTTLGSAMYNYFAFDMYYDSYANRMVAIYNYTNGGLYANAINYNSGSPTVTANQTFSFYNNNNATCCAAFNSTSNAGRVFYSDPSNNYMATRTITLSADGATMTIGSQTIPYSSNFYYNTRAYYFPSIDRFIVQFAPFGSPYSYMFNGSGSQVTGDSSSPSSAGQNWGNYGFYSSPDTTNNVIYIAGSTSSVLAVWSITLTASTMTYNGGTSLNSSSYYPVGTGITYDPTNQRGAIGARGSGNNAQLIGFLPQVFSSNADKFVGFATQSVSTGQPVTVTILGGVNSNQTGLTTATAYYLRYDGTLVTTTTPYGVVARALSATSIQVTTGGAFMKLVSQTTISGNPASVTVSLPTGYQQVQIIYNGLQVRTGGQYIIITGVTSAGSSIAFYGHGLIANSTSTASGFATAGTLYPQGSSVTASDYATFNGYLTINTASSSTPAFTCAFNTSSTSSGANATLNTGYVSSYPSSLTISPGGGSTYWGTGTISVYGIG